MQILEVNGVDVRFSSKMDVAKIIKAAPGVLNFILLPPQPNPVYADVNLDESPQAKTIYDATVTNDDEPDASSADNSNVYATVNKQPQQQEEKPIATNDNSRQPTTTSTTTT